MMASLLWRGQILLFCSMAVGSAYGQNGTTNSSFTFSSAHETFSTSTTLPALTMPPGVEIASTANPDRPRIEVSTVETEGGAVFFTDPAEATAIVTAYMPHLEASQSDLLNAGDRPTGPRADPPQITPPPLIVGTEILRPIDGGAGGYANGEQALLPGGPPITLTLTRPTTKVVTLSLASDASEVFINGQPTALSPQSEQVQRLSTHLPLLTVNGHTLTPVARPTSSPNSPNENESEHQSAYVLPDGQTLLPGSTVVFEGTTICLAPGATQLVVDKSTSDIVLAVETIQGDSRQETGASMTDGPRPTGGVAPAVESESVGGASQRRVWCWHAHIGTVGAILFSALRWT